MNIGTRVRTLARIAASLNTAIYAVSAAVTGLGFTKLTLLWAILTIAADFVVAFFTTYYNNDYSEAGAIGTGVTRQIKAEAGEDYEGEVFFDDVKGGEEDDSL